MLPHEIQEAAGKGCRKDAELTRAGLGEGGHDGQVGTSVNLFHPG